MGVAQQQHLVPWQEQPPLAPGPSGHSRGVWHPAVLGSQAAPLVALGASLSQGGMGEGEPLP